ncbi:MAG: DNA mismatch repair protein MutL, partial [Clostridiales bacterium]|nr:DNA mismatch repair protein MutL [Clostridiales bacterium]
MSEPRIHKLNDSVAQKIAAGEVVDRPASVVKELAENAIDAGSTALAIEIQDGGQVFLRVADNGCGIHADDVRLAFMRHATSKIGSADDLFNIRSMGFRGEALYSIAAVSRLELLTRTQDSELGVRVVMEGGVEACCEPAGCPLGTSVTVRDLFFNMPARQKFMGKPSAESAFIGIMAAKLILSHPDISVKFASGGRTIYHSPGDGSLRNAITAVYGREIAENMIPAESERGGVRVYGFIGNSETFRGNRSAEMLFVNGRMIESP